MENCVYGLVVELENEVILVIDDIIFFVLLVLNLNEFVY